MVHSLSDPAALSGRGVALRALGLTLAVFAGVTMLLLLADNAAGRPIDLTIFVNVLMTFPIVLLAGWLCFLTARHFHDQRLRMAVCVAVIAFGSGVADTLKDAWFAEAVLAQPVTQMLAVALRTTVLHLLMLGALAAMFTAWIENAQRLARERALSLAREAEAAARLAASRAEGAAVEARLSALRYQLNPHFLFNTLNAISSMVVTGRNQAAEGMLERLCDFLRATLASKTDGLVPIEDELATMASYLEIENFRLRDRLHVDFVCPNDLVTALVPGFMLQPLIENAVKHGVGRSSRQVTLRIEVARHGDDRLLVRVSDDAKADLPEVITPGLGVGLGNVSERLVSLYGGDARLTTEASALGFVAELDLPLAFAGGDAP